MTARLISAPRFRVHLVLHIQQLITVDGNVDELQVVVLEAGVDRRRRG